MAGDGPLLLGTLDNPLTQTNTMKCPVCIEPDLVMTDRQGVEIDYCPKCRGVWLDRGELDKVIERSASMSATQPPPQTEYRSESPRDYPKRDDQRRDHDDHDKRGKYDQHGQHKKKSWLSELFD